MPFNSLTASPAALAGALANTLTAINVLSDGQFNLTAPNPTDGQSVQLQVDNQGRLMVNTGVNNGKINQTGVAVATSSTLLLNANPARKLLYIQNQDTTNPIYVAFGFPAVADKTSFKIAATGTLSLEGSLVDNGSVYAISTGASVNTHIMEG